MGTELQVCNYGKHGGLWIMWIQGQAGVIGLCSWA